MKGSLAILAAALLATATGCAAAKPVTMTPVVAEADPWAGFNNGYEKPAAKPEATAEKDDAKPAEKADAKPAPEKSESSEAATANLDADDVAPQPVKKVSKKKKGKKKSGAKHVAGKKPKKRSKRSS